jgi:uncharacterized membrane protein
MQSKTRKIVVTGVLGALCIILGLTPLGFVPWFTGASLTTMHIPVIIGAVLEGPVVGLVTGLIFGLFSLVRAAVAPQGPADVWFVNPLVSVLPRLIIGLSAWLVYNAVRRIHLVPGIVSAGIAGSLTNTALVLAALGLLGRLPWEAIGGIAVLNGLPEAALSAAVTFAVVAAWKHLETRNKGSSV